MRIAHCVLERARPVKFTDVRTHLHCDTLDSRRPQSALHPIEPIPAGIANGGCGAKRPVPADPAERPLCVRKRTVAATPGNDESLLFKIGIKGGADREPQLAADLTFARSRWLINRQFSLSAPPGVRSNPGGR